MQVTSLRELTESLAFDYIDAKKSVGRIALCMLNNTLHEDVSFNAYSDLLNFGPKNDWDGTRSAAERVSSKWEANVLRPGIILFHKLQANRKS